MKNLKSTKVRNIALTILLLFAMVILSACDGSEGKAEGPHAVVTVSDSRGSCATISTTDDINEAWQNMWWVYDMQSNEVSVYFACPTCKFETTWTANAEELQQATMIGCECKGTDKDKRQYFCISVTRGQDYFFGTASREK